MTESIPKEKVKAKIEELRTLLKDTPEISYDRRWVVVSVTIPALESLLLEEEPVKEESIPIARIKEQIEGVIKRNHLWEFNTDVAEDLMNILPKEESP
jgi:hypothetical protein